MRWPVAELALCPVPPGQSLHRPLFPFFLFFACECWLIFAQHGSGVAPPAPCCPPQPSLAKSCCAGHPAHMHTTQTPGHVGWVPGTQGSLQGESEINPSSPAPLPFSLRLEWSRFPESRCSPAGASAWTPRRAQLLPVPTRSPSIFNTKFYWFSLFNSFCILPPVSSQLPCPVQTIIISHMEYSNGLLPGLPASTLRLSNPLSTYLALWIKLLTVPQYPFSSSLLTEPLCFGWAPFPACFMARWDHVTELWLPG